MSPTATTWRRRRFRRTRAATPGCERGDEPPAGLGCDDACSQHADRDEQQPARDRAPSNGGQRSGERDRRHQSRGQEIRISGCRNLEAGCPAAGVEIARQHRSDCADDEAGRDELERGLARQLRSQRRGTAGEAPTSTGGSRGPGASRGPRSSRVRARRGRAPDLNQPAMAGEHGGVGCTGSKRAHPAGDEEQAAGLPGEVERRQPLEERERQPQRDCPEAGSAGRPGGRTQRTARRFRAARRRRAQRRPAPQPARSRRAIVALARLGTSYVSVVARLMSRWFRVYPALRRYPGVRQRFGRGKFAQLELPPHAGGKGCFPEGPLRRLGLLPRPAVPSRARSPRTSTRFGHISNS